MSKFVPRWINNTELRRLGGRYVGVIERVIVQEVHNRFARRHRRLHANGAAEDDGVAYKQPEPVIVFEDGYRLVPNIGMRRLLMERFGQDTDAWTGERLIVVCRSTDAGRETKHLLFPDDDPHDTDERPACVTEHEAGFSDAIGAHDEDDIEAEDEARGFARRRG